MYIYTYIYIYIYVHMCLNMQLYISLQVRFWRPPSHRELQYREMHIYILTSAQGTTPINSRSP